MMRHEIRQSRVQMFGIGVDALTMSESVQVVRDLIRTGTPHQHVVVNAAKVVALQNDARLREIINGCSLVNADGTSIVMAGRVLGRPIPERATGIDLFLELMGTAEEEGWSVFFLGATDEVVAATVAELALRHPRLRVAGSHHGYWEDDDTLVAQIRATSPTILLLAIPSPRKEFWLSEHLEALGVPFVMGVGGSFDIVAGKTRRAPPIAQRLGLEWLFRLAQEPRRMMWRYVRGNSIFILLTIRERWRARR